jgi:hypothetical protein
VLVVRYANGTSRLAILSKSPVARAAMALCTSSINRLFTSYKCLAVAAILAWLLAPYQAHSDSFSHDWEEQLPKPLRTLSFNLDIHADSDVQKIVDELGIEALCLQHLQKQLDDVSARMRVVPYSQIALGTGSVDMDSARLHTLTIS